MNLILFLPFRYNKISRLSPFLNFPLKINVKRSKRKQTQKKNYLVPGYHWTARGSKCYRCRTGKQTVQAMWYV